jgi:uncharacterized phage-associated protein
MPYDALDIAFYFIKKSSPGTPQNITNLKLQKILYYAQGFYHATSENNELLFKDQIQAWVHGPVVPNVYHYFKKYNYSEIDPKEYKDIKLNIDSKTAEFLDKIWELFKNYSGKQLEAKTHQELPWKKIRGDLPEYIYTSTEIPVEDISEYFKEHYLKTVTT